MGLFSSRGALTLSANSGLINTSDLNSSGSSGGEISVQVQDAIVTVGGNGGGDITLQHGGSGLIPVSSTSSPHPRLMLRWTRK